VTRAGTLCRALLYPHMGQMESRSSKNHFLVLLWWDAAAFAFCAALFLLMCAFAAASNAHTYEHDRRFAAAAVSLFRDLNAQRDSTQPTGLESGLESGLAQSSGGTGVEVGSIGGAAMAMTSDGDAEAAFARLISSAMAGELPPVDGESVTQRSSLLWLPIEGVLAGNLFGTWRSQVTFAVMRLFFSLTAAPFFVCTLGSVSMILSHTRPTAFTPQGRLVPQNRHGLSAYLDWLKHDVLESKAYKKELEESFGQEALDKLHTALEDGHVTLKAAEQRRYWGLYTQRVNNRMKAEIDALLRAIITREKASDSLYTHCFPDHVLADEYKKQHHATQRGTGRAGKRKALARSMQRTFDARPKRPQIGTKHEQRTTPARSHGDLAA